MKGYRIRGGSAFTALSDARPGSYRIKWNVNRGEGADLTARAGLVPGAALSLVNSYCGGVIAAVGDKRIALDSESAYLIKV